jgi:hypothetical protein
MKALTSTRTIMLIKSDTGDMKGTTTSKILRRQSLDVNIERAVTMANEDPELDENSLFLMCSANTRKAVAQNRRSFVICWSTQVNYLLRSNRYSSTGGTRRVLEPRPQCHSATYTPRPVESRYLLLVEINDPRGIARRTWNGI